MTTMSYARSVWSARSLLPLGLETSKIWLRNDTLAAVHMHKNEMLPSMRFWGQLDFLGPDQRVPAHAVRGLSHRKLTNITFVARMLEYERDRKPCRAAKHGQVPLRG